MTSAYIGLTLVIVIVYLFIVHMVSVYHYKYGTYTEYRETKYEDQLIALDAWAWPVYFISNGFWFIGWIFLSFTRLGKRVAENLDD